ncbi:MAG: biotin--[acetyl-CoA-carboxylase] ligase [Methylobacillus sp.]|nr:biotin--[acetyl-CoA-carboxylase] ligase [Methylobacillus sp.]
MNSLTFPILRLLSDGHFRSGEALAAQFGVTRATVWNALRDAESHGVRLFSVRGKGYRLPEPVNFLDRERLRALLADHANLYTLEIHDRMESTNSHLMRAAAEGAPHATCVITELQTAGRGRRGRAWQTGLGDSLTFSVLWRFDCGAGALSGLSLAVGVALIRALRELGATKAQLKWPNDIVSGRKKLAGILIELQGDMDGASAAVIGIGLNLRLSEATRRAIAQPATSLQELLDVPVQRDVALATLLRHLADVLALFERGGFEPLRDEWIAHHAYHNAAVRLLLPDGREIDGVAQDVAADGALLVRAAQGVQRFTAGEISLRAAA